MQRMMREAQKMAAEMQKAQEELADVEVEASAGGGAVTVTATADLRIVGIKIDPEMFDGAPDADDIEILGDTVTAAVNEALNRARETQEQTLGPLAGGLGGLGLPGM
ncbi:MAG TPA: YbaB/EbfC family nucleoid-associated protein [Actinomycetota bacterium]|nr:YbaB/EbfC family nucleoid-associated protein [Actinomycetota bacterium]